MGGNIVSAKVTIKGTRPLMWHRFGPEAISSGKQEKEGSPGNSPNEWRKTVTVTKTGQLFIDPSYVFATCREGGKYTKSGRGSMMSAISATLQVAGDRVLIDRWFPGYPKDIPFSIENVETPDTDPDLPVYLDVRGVRNPTTKARNVRYRIAAATGWTAEFTLVWDKTIISREQMQAIVIDAGRLIGVGNGRTIGMGRFEVINFTVEAVS